MLLLGCCPAVLQASLIKLFCIWFKGASNLAMGLYFASASVGIACAQATSNLFPTMDAAFFAPSVLFLLCGVAWALFARDVPEGEAPPEGERIVRYLKTAATSKKRLAHRAGRGVGHGHVHRVHGAVPAGAVRGARP